MGQSLKNPVQESQKGWSKICKSFMQWEEEWERDKLDELAMHLLARRAQIGHVAPTNAEHLLKEF